MQTMAIQIQDDYINDFMSYVNNHSDRITITKGEFAFQANTLT